MSEELWCQRGDIWLAWRGWGVTITFHLKISDTVGHEQITSTHTWGNENSSASKYFYPQGSPNELTPVKPVSMQGQMVIKTERETGKKDFNKQFQVCQVTDFAAWSEEVY